MNPTRRAAAAKGIRDTLQMRRSIGSCLTLLLIASTPNALAAKPAPLALEKRIEAVALASSTEPFTWGQSESEDLQVALDEAAKWWNLASSKKIKLTISLRKKAIIDDSAADCSALNNSKLVQRALGTNSIPNGRILVIFNASSTCDFDGQSAVGGNLILITRNGLQGRLMNYYQSPDKAQFHAIFRSNLKTLLAHELGHSAGLLHSATLNCPNLNYGNSENCTLNPYGDSEDVMGSGSISCPTGEPTTLPIATRYSSGWLSLTRISKPGTYSFTSKSAQKALILTTKLGDVIFEPRVSNVATTCKTGKVTFQNGLEIRYLSSKIAGSAQISTQANRDDAKVSLVKLSKSPAEKSLFIADNSRFFAGESFKVPGTNLRIRLLPSATGTISFKLEPVSTKAPTPPEKPQISLENGGNSTSTLRWQPIAGAVQYVLYGQSATGFETALAFLSQESAEYSLSADDWYKSVFLAAVSKTGAATYSEKLEIN